MQDGDAKNKTSFVVKPMHRDDAAAAAAALAGRSTTILASKYPISLMQSLRIDTETYTTSEKHK